MRRSAPPILALLLLLGAAAGISPARASGWAVLHHDLKVRMDPAKAGLEVVDRLRLGPAPSATEPFPFLLHRDLAPSSVRLAGEELDLKSMRRWRPRDFFARPDYAELGVYATAREHVIAAPRDGWPEGEIELEIEYAGAVYDSLHAPEVAYGRGFETTSGLIDPRGAFLTGQTFWVPWADDGRIEFRLETRLPQPWNSVSQGKRTRQEAEGDRNVTVWESEAPQQEIYLVAGPYTIREREHEGVRIYSYTYENTPAELCDTYLDAAGRYLDLYGERIGPYAFSKWALVENWWQTGFGMPGFTLLGDRVIRLPFIVNTSYGHEILHCWWGNGVYVDYSTGNWCEGLTAYEADYAYKLAHSQAAARNARREALVGYLDFASSAERDFPLSEFRERSDFGTQAIGYGKCMMVFHMLERKVGTEQFDRGLAELYRQYRFAEASWMDIAGIFSGLVGEDLSPWFRQWVERTGAAQVEIKGLEQGSGGWSLQLRQEGEPFELEVPISWTDDTGEHERVIPMKGPETQVALPAELRSVSVDPDWHMMRKVFREEIPPTLSQVLGADSTLVVLGADCDPAMAKALREVAEEWSQNQNMKIVDEADFDEAAAEGRSLFLLGPGPMVDRIFSGARQVHGQAPVELRAASRGKSLIACFRDPEDPELARAIVLPDSPEVAAALGRKIPHYTRYSWLQFEGDQNTGKGAWAVLRTPLRRSVEAE